MEDWEERASVAQRRFADGAARLPSEPDERQRQLTRMANAAWAAGLSLLMVDRRPEADEWLVRAAETYRESWTDAPPESWGRPIGALKARLIAGDPSGARDDAAWALAAGAASAESAIGRYAAALALLVSEDPAGAARLVPTLGDAVPVAVSGALAALAASDAPGYERAIRELLADFASREDFLEDVRVADTVLALQALASLRGIAVELESPLLPSP